MAHLVFIHGIGNKPEPDELLQIWRRVLSRNEDGHPSEKLNGPWCNVYQPLHSGVAKETI